MTNHIITNNLFTIAQIESLSKALGKAATGSVIDAALQERSIPYDPEISTKWKRLNAAFTDLQRRDQNPNGILHFLKTLLEPARFVEKSGDYERCRQEVNVILALVGFEYRSDGTMRKREPARTITEAEGRASSMHAKLSGRTIHPQVMKYCQAEFMQENSFHAVFEATKGLAQRIREESGIDDDGASLVDRVFAIGNPLIAFNTLENETERSEHKGFAALLKGCFAAVRNPLAHQPKILWKGEDDVADFFSLISLLHRKLDDSIQVKTEKNGTPPSD